MKYIAFTIWLLITGIMWTLVFPGVIAAGYGWSELGEKIIKSPRG
jgi:hypothetical protein